MSRSRSRRTSPSSPERRLAVTSATASSATLIRPGFLAPLARRPWRARSSCFLARLVPRSAPLIDAWSRSRSADSSRCRPASSWWRTDAVERKKPSVGTPESSASSSSAWAGSVTTSPSMRRLTVPLAPANTFSRWPPWAAPSSSSYEKVIAMAGRASGLPSHGTSPSSSPAALVTLRVSASSIARWIVDLPASLGPRTTVRPGASSMEVSRYRRRSRMERRVILTASPPVPPAAGGRDGGRRAAPRPRAPRACPASPRARRSAAPRSG